MPISITSNGTSLIISNGGVIKSAYKGNFSVVYFSPWLELWNSGQRVFRISSNTDVSEPSSTDIIDLQDKIIDLLDMTGSEGGGGEMPTDLTFADIDGLPALNRKLGGTVGYSVAQVRAFTGSDPLAFQITGLAGNNLGVYDDSDKVSADDGENVIVSGTRRYKVINVIDALSRIVAALDIFKPNA